MSLAIGSRLGPYEIISTLGAGGMGEVYRARDPRLKRDVALKVLPATLAADTDRLARFQREAEVLASLNHPHIAQVYGIEESGTAGTAAVRALVMELVEGEDLSRQIARGPVPVGEALAIARQIASALEAAHEQGIVHRDLKPANIKVRDDGTVKVLDFGLAKIVEPETAPGTVAAGTMANSPTITSPVMTQHNVILGTAPYLSPEQAKGRPATKRSDIWAFGCVVYEMLAGCRAFSGDDTADTLASVLRGEPDWSRIPGQTPPQIVRLVRACLDKDPATRVPAIAVVRFELDEFVRRPHAAARAATASDVRIWQGLAAVAMIATVSTAIIAWRSGVGRRPEGPPANTVRFTVQMPDGVRLSPSAPYPVGITADGRRIVFVGIRGETEQFFLRSLDGIDAAPIPNTEGAEPRVLLSPDGEWLAAFNLREGTLRKVRLSDGQAQLVSRVAVRPDRTGLRGQAWGSRGTIVFGLEPEPALVVVSDSGGEPKRLTSPLPGEVHGRPFFAADGRHLLFERVKPGGDNDIAALSLETGETRPVMSGRYLVQYAPSHHVFFIENGLLWRARFDPERMQLADEPRPVAEEISIGLPAGPARFAVAGNGTVAYVRNPGGADGGARVSRVVLVDQRRRESPLANLPPGNFQSARVSPQGDRLALTPARLIRSPGAGPVSEISIYDMRRGTVTPVIEDGSYPMWTPDGERLVFFSNRGGERGLYVQRADGSGVAQRLANTGELVFAPHAFLDGGRRLLVSTARPGALGVWREQDVQVIDLETAKVEPLLQESDEAHAELSPDGLWIAYKSTRTGIPEVFVDRFPELNPRVPISTGGGVGPAWSRDGTLLYFSSADGTRIFEVGITVRDRLVATPPREVFAGAVAPGAWGARAFDVMPDGRLVVLRNEGSPTPLSLVVGEHWLNDATGGGR